MNPLPLDPLLERMAEDINALRLRDPLFIGIHTGGTWIAEHLHKSLNIGSALGTLDISFYRDDFSRVGLNPKVKASDLPESVEDREILLVDDVLHSGRTIRAGLSEIFSWGRPACIRLAVALDRPGRELPIHADVIGEKVELASHQQARLEQRDGSLEFIFVETQASEVIK